MIFKLKLVTILALSVVSYFILLPNPILAKDQNLKTTTLESNQSISGDYFAANSAVNLEGIVNGDAYVAGGNINIDGVVNGDLLVAGGNINIRGKILGNLRGAGGQITLAGEVGKNVSLAGGNISLLNGAKVAGNLSVAGGNLSVSSAVGGALNMAGGQVSLSSGARVGKDLTYWSRNQAQISAEASVSGKITQNIPPRKTIPNPLGFVKKAFTFFVLFSLITSFIIGLLLLKFIPNFSWGVTNIIKQKPGTSFLVGLITMLVTPVVMIVLFITIIGIPFAAFLIALMVLLFYLSRIFAAMYVGSLLINRVSKDASTYWSLLLGLIILGILSFIPIIGWLAVLILTLMAVGGVLIEKRNIYQSLRSKKLI